VSLLREVIDAAEPSVRAYAVAEPPAGRFEDGPVEGTRAFVLEAVYEGWLLHYGTPRGFEGMDPDMRLLAGDSLYALGLARLASEGDLKAVAELADLISLCARAAAEDRIDLAERLWAASAQALSGEGGRGAREAVGGELSRSR
jgi:hypothetical protein